MRRARGTEVDVPASKLKTEIARILKEEGYISNYKAVEEEGHKIVRIYLSTVAATSPPSPIWRAFRGRLPGVCAAQRDSPCFGWMGINILTTPVE